MSEAMGCQQSSSPAQTTPLQAGVSGLGSKLLYRIPETPQLKNCSFKWQEDGRGYMRAVVGNNEYTHTFGKTVPENIRQQLGKHKTTLEGNSFVVTMKAVKDVNLLSYASNHV